MDDMRKAFEDWAESECGLSAEFFPDGSYTDGRLRSMWEAWQAATLAEREACAKSCEQVNEATGECPELAQYCADAIRSRTE